MASSVDLQRFVGHQDDNTFALRPLKHCSRLQERRHTVLTVAAASGG
jgi:hypothetical protein